MTGAKNRNVIKGIAAIAIVFLAFIIHCELNTSISLYGLPFGSPEAKLLAFTSKAANTALTLQFKPKNAKIAFALGVYIAICLTLFIVIKAQSETNVTSSKQADLSFGVPTFSFVSTGGSFVSLSDGTAVLSLSGSAGSVAFGGITLSAPTQVPMRLVLYDTHNGTLTMPLGTKISASVNGATFPVVESDVNGSFDPINKLFIEVPGQNVIHISASIPANSQSGTFSFLLVIATFSNSAASYQTYATSVKVNLNVA